MTTVVVADDHQIVRVGLRALLATAEDIQLVGEASDGLEAIRACAELGPDVLVAELQLPHLDGVEVLRRVRQHSPGTRVVVHSVHAAEAVVVETLRHGAMGYVWKGAHVDDLVQAVRAAADGRRYLSPPFADRAHDIHALAASGPRGDPYDTLTARERQVLRLAVEGLTLKEIGVRLSMSRRTAETHRAHLMRKLGLRSPTDLIRYALRRGLLPPEGPGTAGG
jgi:two-component system, NarL family, response regulator NreC